MEEPQRPARPALRAPRKRATLTEARARTAGSGSPPTGVSIGSAQPTVSPTETAAGPILDRLRRAEGQIRGVQRMIEERQDCEAVLTQLLAARGALDRVAGQVVAAHLEECLAGRSPAEARAAIERAVQLLARGG